MTRWEKLSGVLLRLVDSAREQSGALNHMRTAFGRFCDTMDRVESRLDETHASHQKTIRQYSELEARVTRIERNGNAAG